MGKPAKLTPKKRTSGDWCEAFLATLRQTANVRLSCEQAGVARRTAYDRRDTDPEFRAAWESAMEDAVDTLEAVARSRALAISDVLMIFLLKAHRPEKYRDRQQVEHSGAVVQTHVYLPPKNDPPT